MKIHLRQNFFIIFLKSIYINPITIKKFYKVTMQVNFKKEIKIPLEDNNYKPNSKIAYIEYIGIDEMIF